MGVEAAAGETPSLTGEFIGQTHRGLECTQIHPLGSQHQKGLIRLWVVEGVTEILQRVEQAPLVPLGPSSTYSIKAQRPVLPHPGAHLRLHPFTQQLFQDKNMSQMKKEIKAPEKIQLSDEEIANLTDAQLKTLVIRMLTELVEFGHKLDEKNEGYAKRNKGKCIQNQ